VQVAQAAAAALGDHYTLAVGIQVGDEFAGVLRVMMVPTGMRNSMSLPPLP
jgi:hypothetical protein